VKRLARPPNVENRSDWRPNVIGERPRKPGANIIKLFTAVSYTFS
jgi:hypothetical protein